VQLELAAAELYGEWRAIWLLHGLVSLSLLQVPGDSAPEYPLARARMLEGLLVAGAAVCILHHQSLTSIAANSNAHGYGFG
jgi:hypothetical protein